MTIAVSNTAQGSLGEFGTDSNVAIGNCLLSSTLTTLPVGGKVEADEENEVWWKDATASKGSKFLTSTLTHVGNVRPVGGGEVSVRSKVNESEVNDKLNNLKTGDPLLPPNLNTTSRLEIVPIHYNMDKQIQRDGNPRNGGASNELSVAEKSSGTMVVAVQEGWQVISLPPNRVD